MIYKYFENAIDEGNVPKLMFGGILIVAIIATIFAVFVIPVIETPEHKKLIENRKGDYVTYTGWCKQYNKCSMSFEEWIALRDNDLLKGQKR